MADWRLSERAAADLSAIYGYTFRTFGETQADGYVEGLRRTFGLLVFRFRHLLSLLHGSEQMS